MMKVDVKAPYNDLPFLPPAAELETKEVLRYRDAMWTAYNGLKDRRLLTTNMFISIVREIKQAEIGIRNTPGTHLKNDRTGEIDYTPPEGKETIRQKLVNLEKYIHAEEARTKLPDRVYFRTPLYKSAVSGGARDR
jgi:hypothetical protein